MPISTQTQNAPSALFDPNLASQGSAAVEAADVSSTVDVSAATVASGIAEQAPEPERKSRIVTVGQAVIGMGSVAVEGIFPPGQRGRHVSDTDALLIAAGGTDYAAASAELPKTILPSDLPFKPPAELDSNTTGVSDATNQMIDEAPLPAGITYTPEAAPLPQRTNSTAA